MKPSKVSIKNILLISESAMDFKEKCKHSFGWTEKKFISVLITNHCFYSLKNNKSKDWIVENILILV